MCKLDELKSLLNKFDMEQLVCFFGFHLNLLTKDDVDKDAIIEDLLTVCRLLYKNWN